MAWPMRATRSWHGSRAARAAKNCPLPVPSATLGSGSSSSWTLGSVSRLWRMPTRSRGRAMPLHGAAGQPLQVGHPLQQQRAAGCGAAYRGRKASTASSRSLRRGRSSSGWFSHWRSSRPPIAGHRGIQHAQQRALDRAAAQRLGQLQVAPGGGVEQHELLGRIGVQAGQLGKPGLAASRPGTGPAPPQPASPAAARPGQSHPGSPPRSGPAAPAGPSPGRSARHHTRSAPGQTAVSRAAAPSRSAAFRSAITSSAGRRRSSSATSSRLRSSPSSWVTANSPVVMSA